MLLYKYFDRSGYLLQIRSHLLVYYASIDKILTSSEATQLYVIVLYFSSILLSGKELMFNTR